MSSDDYTDKSVQLKEGREHIQLSCRQFTESVRAKENVLEAESDGSRLWTNIFERSLEVALLISEFLRFGG